MFLSVLLTPITPIAALIMMVLALIFGLIKFLIKHLQHKLHADGEPFELQVDENLAVMVHKEKYDGIIILFVVTKEQLGKEKLMEIADKLKDISDTLSFCDTYIATPPYATSHKGEITFNNE